MEKNNIDSEKLNGDMRAIIEEARVILPGVQALFGFQTIAVFNDRFVELPTYARDCHLLGLGMVIIAVALVMTPAAYYRVVEPANVSERMIWLSSLLIRWALAPLALGLTLDMFTRDLHGDARPAGQYPGRACNSAFSEWTVVRIPLARAGEGATKVACERDESPLYVKRRTDESA